MNAHPENQHTGTTLKPPVKSIGGIWRISRGGGGKKLYTASDGHFIQLVERGNCSLFFDNEQYSLSEGDLIFLHGGEKFHLAIPDGTELILLSVALDAPSIPPLPKESRILQSDKLAKDIFHKIHKASLKPPSPSRLLLIFELASQLMRLVEQIRTQVSGKPETQDLWLSIEQHLRANSMFRPSVQQIADIANCSRASVVRMCRKTRNSSPLARLREIRIAEAKALLDNSSMNISQIAEYLGYPRINEFSREFAAVLGHPPTQKNNKKIRIIT